MRNKSPVRLEKQEEEINPLEILNQDIIFKVKFYTLMLILMIIFLAVCFLVQHETYGFLVW